MITSQLLIYPNKCTLYSDVCIYICTYIVSLRAYIVYTVYLATYDHNKTIYAYSLLLTYYPAIVISLRATYVTITYHIFHILSYVESENAMKLFFH